ncbi:fibrobacter succinogenes major paralogous domain-containing protein [Fibrobacter sp. UWB11]|uniref:fibrobacter succinogenes major paralogous domain-containing protein n=1 Tax=Fibrobacter sp. UWB11 TaxID=1896202 RepID=UPI000925BC6D|nr:fibrobacter succinogenes major paralogous domain-containing protein [Fibrobacter sp. UWB11]SIO33199.1 major paralogous domain-containing protein [Fibrobacter sp. UWB11]
MRIPFHTSFTIAALSFFLSACSESFTDPRDGQSYDVVKIGDLTWMAENLNYKTEASVCPDGDSRNCKRLGRLYTWAEAKTVCPEGWRLPTKVDFEKLIAEMFKDGVASSKGDAGAALKAKDGWFKKGNGTDEFGFNALPAGYRGAVLKTDDGTVTGGKFDGIGGYAYFWSATEDAENPESNAYYLFLSFSSDAASLNAFAKADYRSVRCVTP